MMKADLKQILASVVFFTLVTDAVASDKIYRCKQANGKYIYQQNICSDGEVGIDTPQKRLWKKMRRLSGEGENILNSLRGDIESIKQCNKVMPAFKEEVDRLSRLVDKHSLGFPELAKSYSYLKDCTECRTSALSSCQTANRFLDKAMAELL